jgi:hypothetical protein
MGCTSHSVQGCFYLYPHLHHRPKAPVRQGLIPFVSPGLASMTLSTWNPKPQRWGTQVESILVAILFVLCSGVVAYIVRPLDRRRSRRPPAERPVGLDAADLITRTGRVVP